MRWLFARFPLASTWIFVVFMQPMGQFTWLMEADPGQILLLGELPLALEARW